MARGTGAGLRGSSSPCAKTVPRRNDAKARRRATHRSPPPAAAASQRPGRARCGATSARPGRGRACGALWPRPGPGCALYGRAPAVDSRARLSLRSPQRAGVVGAFPPVPTQSIVTTAHPAAIASSAGSAGIRRRPSARPSSVSRRPAPRPGRLSPASIPAFSRGPFSRSASPRHDAGLGADVPRSRMSRSRYAASTALVAPVPSRRRRARSYQGAFAPRLLASLQPRELRGGAAPGEEPLAVAGDHGGAPPAAGLQDGGQLDAGRDHVLRRANAGAVS